MSEEPASELESLLARYVERHLLAGEKLDPAALCADRPQLLAPLRALIERYQRLDRALGAELADGEAADGDRSLPCFPGFRTLERLGRGGAGEVFKPRT